MSTLNSNEIANLLREFGRRAMLYGGNPYRAKAFIRAAERVALLPKSIDDMITQNRLQEIPGVGEAIAAVITELARTGTTPSLERMRGDVPATVLEMLSLPGLRPEKVMKLHKKLGINTLAELEAAAKQDRLRTAKGFGQALQRKILAALEARQDLNSSRHLHKAEELLEAARATLNKSELGLKNLQIAGDFRRGSELVNDLALVAEKPASRTSRLRFGDLTVHVAKRSRLGGALLFATGSEAHLKQLRKLAAKKGYELEPDGLYRDGRLVAARSEEDIYQALGLEFIEPELREGREEIRLSQRGRLPKLIKNDDIKGILHAHTDGSDGVHTLRQMAEAARKRGYTYFGVADHSKSAHYAGGLNLDEIQVQHAEIDELNREYGDDFRIFKGIESDILPDGCLDYPEEVLKKFDFVVASVHGQFRKDRAAQTERILNAVANPYTTILGHMTGRQLLRRPGYEVDVERILGACAEHGVAVEINANPWRLDLDWRWHQAALKRGCMFSINPDAHSTKEIDLVKWGVVMARKGGVPAERVINTLDLPSFRAYLEARARGSESLVMMKNHT
jgi:DNA polymerase (family X)